MKISMLVFFVLLISIQLKAQDPHFSQFYANPMYLNPGLAGTADGNRAVINHRQQWSKPISYITSSLSVDGKLNSANTGWGVQVIQDNQANGLLKQTYFHAILAHRVEISKNKFLGMGLKIGAYQKRLDWSGLTFEDQLDERYGVVNPTNERFGKDQIINGDVSAGFIYYTKNVFAGISANHLNRPSEEFTIDSKSRLPIKYTIHMGGILPIYHPGKEQFISPNIIYERQGKFDYINAGLYYGNETFSIGGWYRINDAIIGSLGMNINNFKFGYTYDVTVSKIATSKNNSHEISLAYLFELPKSYNKGRYKGKCPKFYKYLY